MEMSKYGYVQIWIYPNVDMPKCGQFPSARPDPSRKTGVSAEKWGSAIARRRWAWRVCAHARPQYASNSIRPPIIFKTGIDYQFSGKSSDYGICPKVSPWVYVYVYISPPIGSTRADGGRAPIRGGWFICTDVYVSYAHIHIGDTPRGNPPANGTGRGSEAPVRIIIM